MADREIKRLQEALQSEIDFRVRVQRAFADMILALQRGQPLTMPHPSLGIEPYLSGSPSSPFPPPSSSPSPPPSSSPQPSPPSYGPTPPPMSRDDGGAILSSSVPTSSSVFFPPHTPVSGYHAGGGGLQKSPSFPSLSPSSSSLPITKSPRLPITSPTTPSSRTSPRPSGIALALAAKNGGGPLSSPGKTYRPIPPTTPHGSSKSPPIPISLSFMTPGSPSPVSAVSPGDKKLAEDFRNRGNDLFKQKRYLDAIDMYSRGMQYDPSSSALYFNRAGAYMCLQQYVEAYEDAKKSIEIQPQSVLNLNRLGRICFALGDTKNAKEAYQAVLQIEPTNAMAMKGMVSIAKAEKMQTPGKDIDTVVSDEEFVIPEPQHQAQQSSPGSNGKPGPPPMLSQKALSAPTLIPRSTPSPATPSSLLTQLTIEEEDNDNLEGPPLSPSFTPLKAVNLTKEYVGTLREKYERFKQIRIKLRKQGMANSEETEKTRQATILKLTKSMNEIEDILGIDNRPHNLKKGGGGGAGSGFDNIVGAPSRFY